LILINQLPLRSVQRARREPSEPIPFLLNINLEFST